MATPRANRGFTTTEMMIVVMVVAILAAVAAPNMAAMVRIQRLRTAAFDVYASLNLARSESVKRNQNVSITPSAGGWGRGWTVVDANGNVLKEQSGWDAIDVSGPPAIVFTGSGRATAAGAFNITSADVEPGKHRCVRLDASGRAVSREGTC